MNASSMFKSAPPSAPEWGLMLVWSLLVILVSLSGNFLILYSAVTKRSIKLDSVSVVVIKNLALSELFFTVYIIVSLPNVLVQDYIYPDWFCTVSKTWMYASFSTGILLTVLLNISKLYCILQPLRAMLRTPRTGHVLTTLIWLLTWAYAGGNAVYREVYGEARTEFRAGTYQCSRVEEKNSQTSGWIYRGTAIAFQLLPQIVIIVTTVWLVVLAKRARSRTRDTRKMNRGTWTIITISLVTCLALSPNLLYQFLKPALSDSHKNTPWFRFIYRLGQYAVYLTVAANPFIIYFSVRSFNEYVNTGLRELRKGRYYEVRKSSSSTPTPSPRTSHV